MHDIVHRVIDEANAYSYIRRAADAARLSLANRETAVAKAEAKRQGRRQRNLRIVNASSAG
jgi:hypothetical protein